MSGDLWSAVTSVARSCGEAVALTFPGASPLAYADLVERAGRLATGLAARGVAAGDRVALVARNHPSFFPLLLACARLGATLVPLNARLSRPELGTILDDAGPRATFCDAERQEALAGLVPDLLDLDKDLSSVFGTEPWGGSLPKPSAVALQMYTSGTTGRPKGVMITHANLLATAAEGVARLGGFSPADTVIVALPLFHIAGIDFALFAMAAGARIALLPDPSPAPLADALAAERATKTLLVPAVIRGLVEELEARPRTALALDTLCYGASPMPEELIGRARAVLPGTGFIHVYGMTETTGMFTWLPQEETAAGRRPLSCGKPFPSGALRIVDPSGRDLPSGAVGEIWYRGPQLMAGYWGKPDETAAVLSDGWFRTGDAGSVDHEGYLFVRDRLKDMVKSGGENVYPAEVENVLLLHAEPRLADLAVIGLPDERLGEVVTAVAVPLDPSAPPTLEALQAAARPHLAGFKLPRRLLLVQALPRNAAGKVLKHEVRHIALAMLGETPP